MRTLILAIAVLAGACTGDTPSTKGRKCTGSTYDMCLDEHNCTSAMCHSFNDQGFQVCTVSCTVGDDSTCPKGVDGQKGTCDATGVCVPAMPNDCTLQL